MLALWGGTIGTLVAIERNRPPTVRATELSYLPKGDYLKLAVLGYRQLAADLIWLKAVQSFGTRNQTTEGYLWTYHAVDVLTDLDPKFALAYQVAGSILAIWANRVHESVALLEKGVRHNPEVWQLPFFLGYDYFYELHDPIRAAKYFRMAAELPGSPEYLPKLAARMTVEAGDPDAALEFLQRLYNVVKDKDEKLREGLAWRIREVTAERDIRVLEQAVARYKERYAKLPASLEELVVRGIIPRLPTEPLGGVYRLNPSDGTVTSTGLPERLRVFRH